MIIVGSILKKGDKILMVREAKKECYGKWDFPTGRLEEDEDIFEGAIRETLEESGHKVVLKKMLPIQVMRSEGEKVCRFMFLADSIELNSSKIIEQEILETRYFSINEIKNMQDELRAPKSILDIVKAIENNITFDLDQVFM